VEELIAQTHEAEALLLVTTVNLGEIWYSLARTRSEADADMAAARVVRLGFEAVDADWELARQAAAYKAKFKYASCITHHASTAPARKSA
jgi:hypothetical protein